MFSKLQPHLEILNSLQLHLNAKVLALLSDRGVLNRQGQLDLVCGHVSGRLQLPNSSQQPHDTSVWHPAGQDIA